MLMHFISRHLLKRRWRFMKTADSPIREARATQTHDISGEFRHSVHLSIYAAVIVRGISLD